jgi:hypothetical protein
MLRAGKVAVATGRCGRLDQIICMLNDKTRVHNAFYELGVFHNKLVERQRGWYTCNSPSFVSM